MKTKLLSVLIVIAMSITAAMADVVWTNGSWSAFSPIGVESNAFYGLMPAEGSDYLLASGGGKEGCTAAHIVGLTDGGIATMRYTICDNDLIVYKLTTPKDLYSLRFFSSWGGHLRNDITITYIELVSLDGSVTRLAGNVYEHSVSGVNNLFAFLSDDGGAPLGRAVTEVRIQFGTQENGYVGYFEIEAVAKDYERRYVIIKGYPDDMGAVEPSFGTHWDYEVGEAATFTAPAEPFYNEAGDTRYELSGWRLDCVDIVSGEVTNSVSGKGASYDYVHKDFAVFTWLYDSVYRVTLEGVNCTFDKAAELWIKRGDALSVTATAAEGYDFAVWVGSVEGYEAWDKNPLVWVVSEAASFKAVSSVSYYVDGANGDDANSGRVDAPFKSIAAAVSAMSEFDTVYVQPWDEPYEITGEQFLTGYQRLIGVSGDFNDVVIKMMTQTKRSFNLSGVGVKVKNVTLDGNHLHFSGDGVSSGKVKGGVVYIAGAGTIENCRITRGKTNRWTYGVGIYNDGGKVIDCVIDDCTCGGNIYGGLAIYQSGADALIERCVITNNHFTAFHASHSDPYTSAGVYLTGGVMRNSLIARNTAGNQTEGNGGRCGFAVYLDNDAVMENCAVVDNYITKLLSEGQKIAAVYQVSANAKVRNCIILNNYCTANGAHLNLTGVAPEASNTILESLDGIAGEGNYTDTALSYEIGDDGRFALTATSPGIDKGAMLDWMGDGAVDLYGDERIVGGAPDIGPVEFVSTGEKVVAINPVREETKITATAAAVGFAADDTLVYEWYIDGVLAEGMTTESFEHDFDKGGKYILKVIVKNQSGETASCEIEEDVPSRVVHLDKNSATPTFPYDTEETAAHSFDDLRAWMMSDMTIYIHEGSYSHSVTINILASTTIIGVDGKEKVFLQGQGNKPLSLTGENITIRGITFRYGQTLQSGIGGNLHARLGALIEDCRFVEPPAGENNVVRGACLAVSDEGTVVRNCFIGNARTPKGSETAVNSPVRNGLGLYINGGLVENCVISNNVIYGAHRYPNHNNGCGVQIAGGTIRNCLITDNHMTDGIQGETRTSAAGVYRTGGRIENCTIVGNSAGSACGGYYSTTSDADAVINTIIYDNINGVNGAGQTSAVGGDDANLSGGAQETMLSCHIDNPRFRTVKGNPFALTTASPCFNSGTNLLWMTDAVDLQGGKRIYGNFVDIGAFELQRTAPTIMRLE